VLAPGVIDRYFAVVSLVVEYTALIKWLPTGMEFEKEKAPEADGFIEDDVKPPEPSG